MSTLILSRPLYYAILSLMELLYAKEIIPVLFENNSCLVLNKPAGLAVQGGKGIKVSLDSLLSEQISPRPLLVHRLDRDTSGIILVAKTKEYAARYSGLFMERKYAKSGMNKNHGEKSVNKHGMQEGIVKQYLGFCFGIPEKESGAIRIGLETRGKGQADFLKYSVTFYRRLSEGGMEIPGDAEPLSFSLLELELETGRMHQIRRHLANIGNPLLGDDKYGIFQINKKLRKAVGLRRLLLHASRLIIPPLPELIPEGLDISAALPGYFSPFSLCLGAEERRGAVDLPSVQTGLQ